MKEKEKETKSTITLGGMALCALVKALNNGNVGAAIYALNNPAVAHLDVYTILSDGHQASKCLNNKLREIQTPTGKNNENRRRQDISCAHG